MRCPRVTRASVLVPDRTAIQMVASQPDHPPPLQALPGEAKHDSTPLSLLPPRPTRLGSPPRQGPLLCRTHVRLRSLGCEGFGIAGARASPRCCGRAPWPAHRALSSPAATRRRPARPMKDNVARVPTGQTLRARRRRGSERQGAPDLPRPYTRAVQHPHSAALWPCRAELLPGVYWCVDSPLCSRCLIPETPAHFLLTCQRYTAERHALRQEVGEPLSPRTTIGSVKARAAVLKYMRTTGRFEAYRLEGALD
ncbi:hypothetical protein BD413DRAFT_85489 [Trametes elegans]|nr:hypothetical protein BD413DRAFT_85489 [Trametes elegans]